MKLFILIAVLFLAGCGQSRYEMKLGGTGATAAIFDTQLGVVKFCHWSPNSDTPLRCSKWTSSDDP